MTETRFSARNAFGEEIERVISVDEENVVICLEVPASLEEPPYFCGRLLEDTELEGGPALFGRYLGSVKRDWSDTSRDVEYACVIPRFQVEQAIEAYEREKEKETTR